MPADPAPRAAFVAYYRVSTDRQGRSGPGLEAQREAVLSYLAAHGADALRSEFTEVESGRRADRLQLAAALAVAKARGTRLSNPDATAARVLAAATNRAARARRAEAGRPLAERLTGQGLSLRAVA